MFFTIYVLYDFYRKEKDSDTKRRAKLILLGSLIVWAGSGFNNFPLWYNIKLLPWGNGFMSIYLMIVAYTVFKYKWLDIEVIIKKTLVFAGLLASVLAILILPTILLQEYLFRNASVAARLIGLTISGIVIIFTMRRTEDFLINVTDKYLFQKKYDYKDLLKTFTSEVLTVLELDKLVNLTVSKLVDIVKIDSSAVLLFDNETQQFGIVASHNVKDPEVTLIRSDGIVTFLERTHGYLLMSDLKEKKVHISESIQGIMEKLRAELIIPMVVHKKVMGILSLGKKKSDEGYSQDDLDILLPLAGTLAIAISNAQLFEELGKTQAEAAQKMKMAVIGTLAAGMAHEIRNPITTIKIFAEYFKEKKDDPYFIEKFQQLVPREVEKINDMITHLLEFSKPADYKTMEPVDLKEALDEVLEILEAEMVLNDIMLEEKISAVSMIYGNKKYIQEIFFNLIQNAIHAIGQRGGISIDAKDSGKHIEITIKDTGRGIAEENIKHIFEPFFTTKMDATGVGLGLYVIKQLVTRMEGIISVESKVGEGTIFRLRFNKAKQ